MPLVLMLVAGAVTCIITFIKNCSMFSRLLSLLIVLLVFYFIGCVIKWTLDYFDLQNEEKNIEEGEVIEKDTEVEPEEKAEENEESENEESETAQ